MGITSFRLWSTANDMLLTGVGRLQTVCCGLRIEAETLVSCSRYDAHVAAHNTTGLQGRHCSTRIDLPWRLWGSDVGSSRNKELRRWGDSADIVCRQGSIATRQPAQISFAGGRRGCGFIRGNHFWVAAMLLVSMVSVSARKTT